MCGLSHKKFDNFTNIPLFQIANPATVETSKSDRDSNHTSAIRPSIVGSHSAPIYHCHACSEKPSAPSVPQKTQALTLVLNDSCSITSFCGASGRGAASAFSCSPPLPAGSPANIGFLVSRSNAWYCGGERGELL